MTELLNPPPRRRSQRVMLRMAITVWGGAPARATFSEETHTIVVNAHGALISLTANTSMGDLVEIQSPVTSETRTCRVVHSDHSPEGKNMVGLEFTEPAPHFWQISFPPDDWVNVSEAVRPQKTSKV